MIRLRKLPDWQRPPSPLLLRYSTVRTQASHCSRQCQLRGDSFKLVALRGETHTTGSWNRSIARGTTRASKRFGRRPGHNACSSRNDCACSHGMPDAALGCPDRILQLVEALAHDSISALEIAERRRFGRHRMISQRRVALAHAFCVAKARLVWPTAWHSALRNRRGSWDPCERIVL